jgi:hypothetical protein
MRRYVLLLFFVGTAIVLAAGIAFAVTKECAGDECSGTLLMTGCSVATALT